MMVKQETKERISIVIPTFNSELYIRRCLDSVCQLSYNNLEIIIVDDRSTDRTVEICTEYSKSDKRITVINSDAVGVSAARNIGIRKATGEYIQFLDSDDALEENMTQVLYESLQTTGADIAVCGYYYIKQKEKQEHSLLDLVCTKESMLVDYLSKPQNEGFFNYIWNKLYRRRTIIDNGIQFDENVTLAEDALFNMDIFKVCDKFVFVKNCLYKHFDNEGSLEKQKKDINSLGNTYFNICNKYEQIYEKNCLDNKHRGLINNKYLYYTMVLIDTVCIEGSKSEQKKFVQTILNNKAVIRKIGLADCYNTNYRIMKQLIKIGNVNVIIWFTKMKIKLKG